jgi:hypothetical protein
MYAPIDPMIESRCASSSGSGISCASARCWLGRRRLISAWISHAVGSRSVASNAGRKNGSKRRCTCSIHMMIACRPRAAGVAVGLCSGIDAPSDRAP